MPKGRELVFRVAFVLCACTFLVSAALITQYHTRGMRSERAFRELSRSVKGVALADTRSDDIEPSALQALHQTNPDMVGWIRIEGTEIDYPIMQTPIEPEYYLKRNFEGQPSDHGTPFLDARCGLGERDNWVIYGHHMKDGTMFAGLLAYQDPEYWKAHPDIQIDVPGEKRTYRIYAVLKTQANAEYMDAFRAERLIDADPKIKEALLSRIFDAALYDTKEWVHSGEPMLVLSTCEYTREDGRLLVVARRLPAAR